MRRSPLPWFLVLLALGQVATGVRAADDLAARVDDYVRGEMTRQKIPGLAVAIAQRGEVTHARGYGLANVEHDVAVTVLTEPQDGGPLLL